jgi:hypothetical protein
MMQAFGDLEDPGYASWVQCGIGSFVVLENTSESPLPGLDQLRAAAEDPGTRDEIESFLKQTGVDLSSGVMKMVSETRSTLVDITSEAVKIQVEHRATVNGTPTNHRVLQVLPAKPEPESEGERVWSSGTADEGASVVRASYSKLSSLPALKPAMESEERLQIAGLDILCRCVEQSSELLGRPFWMKSWFSDLIPGGLAQRHIRFGPPPGQSTRFVVTSFKKK